VPKISSERIKANDTWWSLSWKSGDHPQLSLGRNADLSANLGLSPTPSVVHALMPILSNRHKRIISLAGRNYEIHFGLRMFPKDGEVRRGGD
jgi:hypothetical protein